jgi:hypothetical protein
MRPSDTRRLRGPGGTPRCPGVVLTVTLWVNHSRQPVGAPLRPRQVAGQAVLAAILAPAGLALVLLCIWLLARSVLDRRRLAGWEAAWRSTGPQWSRLS